jgi:hypothetical protein
MPLNVGENFPANPALSRANALSAKEIALTEFINPKELARRWNRDVKTLERHRSLGLPPKFLKIHGRIAYRLEDIEAFEATRLFTRVSESKKR